MTKPIENLRIHFYGVQGSGGIYPRRNEREIIRESAEVDFLRAALKTLSAQDANRSIKSLHKELGTEQALKEFRASLKLHDVPSYGGWTTCFRLETSDGYDIIIDCGSGFRLCAQDLEKKWGQSKKRVLTILGTHAHFDHTEGFDQSGVCFDPRNHIHVIANRSYLLSLDRHLGIFSKQADRKSIGRPTPLAFDMMPATFEATEIRAKSDPRIKDDPLADQYLEVSKPFKIGKTSITPFSVFHPDPCLAYRIEHKGKVFVFCTDHELRRGDDPDFHLQKESVEAEKRLIEYARDADVLYRDGQFLRSEYDAQKPLGGQNPAPRKDWGHSCIEDVVDMAKAAKVKRTYIGHHDPNRSWRELVELDQQLKVQSAEAGLHFEMAKAETVIDL